MLKTIFLSLLFTIFACVYSSPAAAIDPHQLYEQNCARCHSAHARNFVELNIRVKDEKLIGRYSKQSLMAFLQAGHGRLNSEEIMVLTHHFEFIKKSKGLFHKKCSICHGRAVEFARKELFIKDGVLVGRYSKRIIEEYLVRHGQLNEQDIPQMIEVLWRQLETSAD